MVKPSVDHTLRRAKSHVQKGEIDEARTLYQTVLQAFPSNNRAKLALSKLGHLKQQNSKRNPSQAAIRQLVTLLNRGELSVVAGRAKKLTREYPSSFLLWNILGAANRGLGRLEMAVVAFQKACASNPRFQDAYNNLGVTLSAQGNFDEAVANFKRALALKSDYFDAYYNLGNTFLKQGNLDEAATSFVRSLEIKPDYADAHNDLGITLQQQGKLNVAIASFLNALEIKPDYAEVHNNLGVTLDLQGKADAATARYLQAIEIKSDYDQAHFNLAAEPTDLVSESSLDCLENFHATRKKESNNSGFQFLQANILRHKGEIDESFRMLKIANNSAENKAKIQSWQKRSRKTADEIARWMPFNNKSVSDKNFKLLFILGPSRSGKSTIEAALGERKGFKSGFEGWRGVSGEKYLNNLNVNNSRKHDPAQQDTEIEKILFYTEENIQAEKIRVLTCTNPSIISEAHLIHEVFYNACFLFVRRDAYVTASEIFSKEYREGNFYSYNAQSAFDYVNWYNEVSGQLLAKMPQRAASVNYEEFIEDQVPLTSLIENLLNMKLGPDKSAYSAPRGTRTSVYLDHYKRYLREFE